MFNSLLMVIIMGKEENLTWSGIAGSVSALVSAGQEAEAALRAWSAISRPDGLVPVSSFRGNCF